MMDYSELVKSLRICVKSTDCIGCIKNADGTEFGCKPLGDSELVLDAADAIEELQSRAESLMADAMLWEDMARDCKARCEELQKQLQKSEADNVNLTGWLAEEHAKNCPHYIRNVHDRGDDSFCDVLMTEPPRVDPCADCVHYPPSSTDGKPCCACDQANPLTNCHEAKEKTE